jgi:Ca2+-binding RTX toxin-like protein
MRARRPAILLAAIGCCLAAFAPGAQAGEVAVHFGDTLRFLPNDGEVNTVTLARSGPDYVVTDTTTPITPGLNCTAVSANQVTCPAAMVEQVSFGFGDLADTGSVAATVSGSQSFSLFIDGNDGNDTLNAGPRLDFGQYSGGEGNDTLNGGPESDRLLGGDGNDISRGADGDDSIEADDGNDILAGENGNDRVDGGSPGNGADVISGGPGEFDDLDYRRPIDMHLDANGVADDGAGCPGAGCEGDNVAADFERIDTGEGDDVVRPGGGPNLVFAGEGNDVVDGQGGRDELLGDDGADILSGGRGDDQIRGGNGVDQAFGGPGDDSLRGDTFDLTPDLYSGGPGLDIVDFDGASEALRIDLDNNADDGRAGEGDNVRTDVEDVTGGSAADVIVGTGAANELSGGGGSDRLFGRGGADGLFGDSGADTLVGGKASDLLDGGAGGDRLRARDRRRDEVRCGSAFDTALADRIDRRSADCDRVRVRRSRP